MFKVRNTNVKYKMAIIIFVVDTSFSMSAKNYRGCSTLDMARSFISEFMKVYLILSQYFTNMNFQLRCRDVPYKLYDKYYVITSETFPKCIKVSSYVGHNVRFNKRSIFQIVLQQRIYNSLVF